MMFGEASAGKLVVEIVGDIAGLTRAYDEAVKRTEGLEGDLKTIGSRLTSIGSDLTLKVTAPLALAGVGMVKLASDASETQAKFEQVFGDMTDDMNEWVEAYGTAQGRARTDLQEMTATMMSIVKAMGLAGEEGAELSTTITQLSVDMGAFHNVSDEEAFVALRAAIIGSYMPMRRFGVVLSEAAVEQELLNMGIEGGTEAASDAEKAQARLNLIMQATTDVQGAAAREAGGLANQTKALTADLKELGEEFGQELLPLAQDLVSVVRDVIGWISGFDSSTKKLIATTGLLVAAVGPAVWVLGSMATSVGSLINLYTMYQASTIAATIATRGFSAALMSTPAGLVLGGVTLLAGALLVLSMNTDRASEAADRYTRALSQTSEELRKMADETRNAESEITKLWNAASTYIGKVRGDLNSLVRPFGTLVLGIQSVSYAFDDARQAARDAEADTYEYLGTLKDVATVAETELRRADSAFRDHQTTVNNLQTEYSKLELEYGQMCTRCR